MLLNIATDCTLICWIFQKGRNLHLQNKINVDSSIINIDIRQMFSKLLQSKQLSSQEQRDILKKVIQVNVKQNLPEVRLQFTHNYEQLKPIFIHHWKYSLLIAFALINWQTAREFLEGKREGAIFDLLTSIAISGQLKHSGTYIVKDLCKTYPDQWRCLVILKIIAESLAPRITSTLDYGWLLSGFVKISATIIQNYLNIKNEPAKSSQDRTEKDLSLVSKSEEWVTQAFIQLFKVLKSPTTPSDKRMILSACTQVSAALYEGLREGFLKPQLLHDILNSVAKYVFSSYRLDELVSMFTSRLRELKYCNPIKKIEIPDEYSEASSLQTQGICWLLSRGLENCVEITSEQMQLDLSVLLFSQMVGMPYRLKEQLIAKVKQLSKRVTPSASFEVDYPVALVLFNTHQHQRESFELLSTLFGFEGSKEVKVNRLKRLLAIQLESFNVEKTQFVLKHLDEDCLQLKQALILAKSVQFNFTNPQISNLITILFQKIVKIHGETGRKNIISLIERERQAKRNSDLCLQLEQNFGK